MLAAAKEEMLSPSMWSEEEIFSLAALSAVALETHVGASTINGQKPHQGVAPQKSALHQPQALCNSTIALGVSWWWWSGTASGAGVSYDYDAFGNLINQTGTTPNVYLFAGEQYDSALGLYYNRARYLNPTTGRFWSMDTDDGSDRDPASLHKYLYTGANPVDRIDSSGNDFDLVSIGTAEVVGERIDSMSILYGIAALGFVVANFTSTKTDDDDPRYPNRMRVQLQEGLQNTFYGRSAHNTSAVGVTVFQMREAMQNLFEDAQDDTSFGRNRFPFAVLQSWLFSAVISLSIRLGTFPPGGIPIPKPNFIQETTKYRGKEYRLDMDNLAGWNLRQ